MAKKLSPEEAQNALNLISIGRSEDAGCTFEEAMDILEKADPKGMTDLTRQYFTFEKHGVYTFLVEGMTRGDLKESKDVELVLLKNKNHELFINGDKLLVDAAKKLTALPAYVRIEYVEDRKGPKGSYKVFKIHTFSQNTAK